MPDRRTESELESLRRQVAALTRRLDQLTYQPTSIAVGIVISGSAPDDEPTGQEYEYTEIVVQVFERKNRTDTKYRASSTQITTTCHTPGEYPAGTFVIMHHSREGDWIIQNATCDPRIADYEPPEEE